MKQWIIGPIIYTILFTLLAFLMKSLFPQVDYLVIDAILVSGAIFGGTYAIVYRAVRDRRSRR